VKAVNCSVDASSPATAESTPHAAPTAVWSEDRYWSRSHSAVLLIVLGISLAYVWPLLDRGWVPHDDGSLAESAVRVLRGELPHRDFDEIYTGALSYVNALAFEIWGTRLIAMRYMVYAVFACWVPLVYFIASRFAGPLTAALVTLASVAWSFPNYTAAMPSWYNLFLGTASVAALFRFVETRKYHWLTIAGALAGISCLFKIVGLFLVAGSLLFLLFTEQNATQRAVRPAHRLSWYGALVVTVCVAFCAALARLVWARLGWTEFIHFVLPGVSVAGLLIVREWQQGHTAPQQRLREMVKLAVAYGIGFLLPVVLFAAFYLAAGALGDLTSGVLIKPLRRLTFTVKHPPPLAGMVAAILVAAIVTVTQRSPRLGAQAVAVTLAPLFLAVLVAGDVPGIGQLGWLSLSQAVPLTILFGLLSIHGAPRGTPEPKSTEHLMVLLCVLAVATLIQFPWSGPTYFTYIAPLEILAATAVLSSYRSVARPVSGVLLTFYLLYGVLWVNPRLLEAKSSRGLFGESEIATLVPGRADLRIKERRLEYEGLIRLINARASGEFIYASPDCPELYFLAGRLNPTRTLFDFLDDTVGRTQQTLGILVTRGVNLVVVNAKPSHSGPMPPELRGAFARMYPNDSTIGQFTVRWR
jgi:hypothetical protein